ncbi:glycosyltransferase [Actinoplanes sp. N902-109]|uniref:glycosyltransferase n=1 Tax=Actinoplanes sp. (strain N902-109) TaxID=649831 RepID=UPI0012FC6369|nr:glycosyltransferase [Actinoplanes sp. N902-109]
MSRPCVLFHAAVGVTLDLFVAPVSAALAEHGVRRIAVAGRGSVPPGLAAHFDDLAEVTPFRRGSPRSLARATGELHRIVTAVRPGLLHLHSPYAIALGRLVARATGTPHLAVVHGTLFGRRGPAGLLFGAIESATAWLTPRYVTVNPDDAASYRRLAPRAEVAVAPCGGAGLDVEKLRRDATGSRRLPGRAPRILALCRLTPDKNLDLTVAAWRLLRAGMPDLELRIVGSAMPGEPAWQPPDEPGVTTAAWTGAPGRELAAADVLLSTSPREGFSLNLAEALVLGTPVVAVANRGSRAVAGQAGAGITLVPGDPVAVAAALATCLRSAARPAVPAAARAWARAGVVDFHVARILDALRPAPAPVAGPVAAAG